MYIEVLTPEAYLYTGEIKAVILPGELGRLEIKRDHAPLISTLIPGVLKIVEPTGYTCYFDVTCGVVEVVDNKIMALIECPH